MAIDRNARARLGAKLRSDPRLTPTTRLVGHAALFACMDARIGRCQAYRARLARESACSERSVTRATQALQNAGYITVVPTYGQRRRQVGGRWFRPRGANVLQWHVPTAFFLSAKASAVPSVNINRNLIGTLPEGPSNALARFGHAIADRSGLRPDLSDATDKVTCSPN